MLQHLLIACFRWFSFFHVVLNWRVFFLGILNNLQGVSPLGNLLKVHRRFNKIGLEVSPKKNKDRFRSSTRKLGSLNMGVLVKWL